MALRMESYVDQLSFMAIIIIEAWIWNCNLELELEFEDDAPLKLVTILDRKRKAHISSHTFEPYKKKQYMNIWIKQYKAIYQWELSVGYSKTRAHSPPV